MKRSQVANWLPTTILVSFLMIPVVLLSVASSSRAQSPEVAAGNEDAWRRTASGWELVGRWNETVRPGYSKLRPAAVLEGIRLDSHPAVLALVQALVIIAAFVVFPPGHRNPGIVANFLK